LEALADPVARPGEGAPFDGLAPDCVAPAIVWFVGTEVEEEENLLLMFDIHDARLVTTPPTFSELARLSRPGRRSGDFEDGGVTSRAGEGAEGNAVVVSFAGCERAAGVTCPGQELFLWASDRLDCAADSSPLLCDEDLVARLMMFVAEVDRDRVAGDFGLLEYCIQLPEML